MLMLSYVSSMLCCENHVHVSSQIYTHLDCELFSLDFLERKITVNMSRYLRLHKINFKI